MYAATTVDQQAAAGERMSGKGWHVPCPPSFVWRVALAALLALTLVFSVRAADDEAPLYRYDLGSELTAAELGELAALLPAGTVVQSARVLAPGQSRPLADLRLARTPQGPVLLDWHAQVDDPFLTLLPALVETTVLAPVLARHVPEDAVVLAWWDVSRQIRLLTGAEVVFSESLGEPLFVPVRWHEQADEVREIEQAFWQVPDAGDREAGLERFRRFATALLAPEEDGIAALRALGQGKPVVLVLHLRDLILLGQMAPQDLGVAFSDFGTLSEVHGMVQRVRAWMRENDHAAYGLMQSGTDPVRAIAVTDEASSRTLVARLLPLVGNDQGDVEGARLVYRTGGYVVFEIAAEAAADNNPSEPNTSP